MIGTNIPGMTNYFLNKQKKTLGSGPTAPAATTTPAPTPPMQGYVGQVATQQSAPTPPKVSFMGYQPFGSQKPGGPGLNLSGVGNAGMTSSMSTTTPPVPALPMVGQATPSSTTTTAPPYMPSQVPKAGASGSSLQDPGQITEAGKLYAQRITANLQGNNPLIQNAQQTEDTAAARRGYLAKRTTEEGLAQTPYGAASAQYQRAMDESQAGVNAANQSGRNAVNDFTRKTTADTLAAAAGLEDQQYGRAVGERTDARTQGSDLGNSIQDPKAKYAFNAMVASGVDPRVAYQQIVGSLGTINEKYRGQSPVQNVQQDATDWIKATQPGLAPGTPEFQVAVTQRMQETDKASRNPISEVNNQAEIGAAKKLLANNHPITPGQREVLVASGDIPTWSSSSLKFGKDANEFIGKTVNIDGRDVKVKSSGNYATNQGDVFSERSRAGYVELEIDGKTYFADSKGNWFNEKPTDKEYQKHTNRGKLTTSPLQ